MTDLNFGECIGCGLCILGCPAYEETGFDVLTARGRNKGLQAGLAASEMVESIWACTLCGYCDAICPNEVRNVDIVLHLRRELALSEAAGRVERLALSEAAGGVEGLAPGKTSHRVQSLVLGCTIRERAPHLIPSIRQFLSRIGRPSDAAETSSAGCCGSLEVEAGRALPVKVKAGVVADPVCIEQYDAEFLGVLAMQHLELFDLEPPFYYYAPHRLVNRDHARLYPLYDGLRRRFGCDMNFDLNRLARSTSAGSVQGLSGRDARDIPAAVARLLAHSRADRIITCSPADYLAFKAYSGRETRFITECLR
jgi:ferredoxin